MASLRKQSLKFKAAVKTYLGFIAGAEFNFAQILSKHFIKALWGLRGFAGLKAPPQR